eukprot:TRINITY_DN20909_c0_g1_i1.p4 TRINITY_DN20909_c0_g1~~TRINITY_DN20909_c0_g1_i1.p4  ORF type:complete len:109 (+),score=13.00 TRINITY_DN20909_c0_g1_i1:2-328(+)
MTSGLPDEVGQTVLKAMSVPRLGAPEDIAAAVSYASSDEAGFLTGQVHLRRRRPDDVLTRSVGGHKLGVGPARVLCCRHDAPNQGLRRPVRNHAARPLRHPAPPADGH